MKRLEIEWKHLDIDGNTCVRCSHTGEALQEVIGKLADECKPFGWEIKLRETRLTVKDMSESNVILFNGKAIEDVLHDAAWSESHCASCSKLTGKPSASCRTLEYGGNTYEGIPASLIRQAACQITQCC